MSSCGDPSPAHRIARGRRQLTGRARSSPSPTARLVLLALLVGQRRHPLNAALTTSGSPMTLRLKASAGSCGIGLGVGRGRRADVGVPLHVELRAHHEVDELGARRPGWAPWRRWTGRRTSRSRLPSAPRSRPAAGRPSWCARPSRSSRRRHRSRRAAMYLFHSSSDDQKVLICGFSACELRLDLVEIGGMCSCPGRWRARQAATDSTASSRQPTLPA